MTFLHRSRGDIQISHSRMTKGHLHLMFAILHNEIYRERTQTYCEMSAKVPNCVINHIISVALYGK